MKHAARPAPFHLRKMQRTNLQLAEDLSCSAPARKNSNRKSTWCCMCCKMFMVPALFVIELLRRHSCHCLMLKSSLAPSSLSTQPVESYMARRSGSESTSQPLRHETIVRMYAELLVGARDFLEPFSQSTMFVLHVPPCPASARAGAQALRWHLHWHSCP